jgi:enoyl-CoA hydratase/carnithine racemase
VISYRVADQSASIDVDDLTPLSRHEPGLTRDLRDAIVAASDDDDVKVILLRATSEDFCAAVSNGSMPAGDEIWTGFNQSFTTSNTLYQSMCFAKKVIITEVSGECADAGSMLVLCSDLTVATDTATFRSPFAELPESNFVLTALTIRLNRAKAWLLDEEPMSSAEALAFGLVNRVVDADELASASAAMARSVTRMPLDGVTMSKMLLQSVLDAHGVGREFDMAGFYASALVGGSHVG